MPSRNQLEILGIIPARGGSKGVIRKNVRSMAGRPLIAYTIDAARHSRVLTRYVCTTDDAEVAGIARAMQCALIRRPEELADDTAPMKLVIQHTLRLLDSKEGYRPDIAVLLQPTSPLRTSRHIDLAVEMMLESRADSVVSVTEVPAHYHPDWQLRLGENRTLALWNGSPLSEIVTRRQDLLPSFTRNGAVYAFQVASFLRSGTIYGDCCLGFVMNPEDSINIDTETDFSLAESRLAELHNASQAEANH